MKILTDKNIDNPNDRCILYILGLLENKKCKDNKRLLKLSKVYPTNDIFEWDIYLFLLNIGFLKDNACGVNHIGQTIYDNDEKVISLTNSGLLAYRSGYFRSELEKFDKDVFRSRLSNASITIAIIGGLAGIITTIINLYYFL